MSDWNIRQDEDGIAWLEFDKQGASTNVLSAAVMRELGEKVEALERLRPKAVIVRSMKASGFIAGADVTEFVDL